MLKRAFQLDLSTVLVRPNVICSKSLCSFRSIFLSLWDYKPFYNFHFQRTVRIFTLSFLDVAILRPESLRSIGVCNMSLKWYRLVNNQQNGDGCGKRSIEMIWHMFITIYVGKSRAWFTSISLCFFVSFFISSLSFILYKCQKMAAFLSRRSWNTHQNVWNSIGATS